MDIKKIIREELTSVDAPVKQEIPAVESDKVEEPKSIFKPEEDDIQFLKELSSDMLEALMILNEDLVKNGISLPSYRNAMHLLINRKGRKEFFYNHFRLE